MDLYEGIKRLALLAHSQEWDYIKCVERSKGKHLIKCSKCGAEKIVYSLYNIKPCFACKKEKIKKEKEKSKNKTCLRCGAIFKPIRSTALYCSERCSQAMKNERNIEKVRAKRRTRKRLRELSTRINGKVDYSITLSKLIVRDKHICQLCGREVNESDYVYIGDTFIAGNNYPSIDHIKPLSKGGTHQWDNVQLAHRLCNSIKRDRENK